MTRSQSKRTVLVAVTGLTPQIVTETLHAMVASGNTPDEVHILTTGCGREHAMESLLVPGKGHFTAFCEHFGLAGRIAFDETHIHVFRDRNGEDLWDLRTQEDNSAAADMINSFIRDICADSNVRLFTSIAGGRKSMGVMLGCAMVLYGRRGDVMTHVLASPEFEMLGDFFYPEQNPRFLFNRDGVQLDARKATITMSEIPYVRIRDILSEEFFNGANSFEDACRMAQSELSPDPVIGFDAKNSTCIYSGRRVKLTPAQFAVQYFIAKVMTKTGEAVSISTDEAVMEYLDAYRAVVGAQSTTYKRASANLLAHTCEFPQYFREKNSCLRRTLKGELGTRLADLFRIRAVGKRTRVRYCIGSEESKVSFEGI